MKRGVIGVLLGMAVVFLGPALGNAMGSGKAAPTEEYVKTKIMTLTYAESGIGAGTGTEYVYSDCSRPYSIYVDGGANVYIYFRPECGMRQYDSNGKYIRTLMWSHEICSWRCKSRNAWHIHFTKEGEFALVSNHPDYRKGAILIHPNGEQENIEASVRLGTEHDWYYIDGCVVDAEHGRGVVGRSRKAKAGNIQPGVPREKLYDIDVTDWRKKGVKVKGPEGTCVVREVGMGPESLTVWEFKTDEEGNIYIIYRNDLEDWSKTFSRQYFLGKYGRNGKLKAWIELERIREGQSLRWAIGQNGQVFQMWIEDPMKGGLRAGAHMFVSKWENKK